MILKTKKTHGSILILTLVFTGIFAVVAVGIASVVNYQYKLAQAKIAWHNALNIAEAGLNYYRWHLAHAPTDYQDGTAQPGPYVHDYLDPQGAVFGQYKLEITPPNLCTQNITIQSTGWTSAAPQTKRKLQIKYGKKSLANFAFITNTDAWFGSQETIHGLIHSNGGIHQDGTNDSQVTSARQTYTCTRSQGCSYSQTKPGVWGTGENNDLWSYPVSNIDFNALTVNLAALKNLATSSGIYLPQRGLGYHIRFKADGKIDVYRVTSLETPVTYYDMNGDKKRDSWDIDREEPYPDYFNYQLPSDCVIIFVADNVWVDGTVNGRVTIAAAKLPEVPNNRRNIIINGNILYQQKNGDDVLGLIAQQDIMVPFYSAPNTLEINAAMIAQNGSVYRPYYPNDIKDTITVYGSIITNQTWTWTWVSSGSWVTSGYQHTNTQYDSHLTYGPPPSFPSVDEYSILQWEEITEK